jgi:predicted kinase
VPGETPIVVVTGPPASGKTTVAEAVAGALGLPLIAKDPIKEVLFESLGVEDVESSKRLGRAVYPLLFHLLEQQLRAGRACVLEANFDHAAASEELGRLQARLAFRALQIVCDAAPAVLLARYSGRTRHPGHMDDRRLDDVREAIEAGRWRALSLDGETIELDTTDWASVDVGAVVERARLWLRATP